jgi:transcription antitermination factor NusG
MDLAWYAVRTNIRCEERARMGLQGLAGVVAYLPRESVLRGRGSDRKVVQRPFLPRHLFVGMDGNRFEAVRTTDGVESILSAGRFAPPQPVRWREIAIIQTAEGEVEDEFQRKLANDKRAQDLADRGKEPVDTDEFVERLKAAAPEDRPSIVIEMLSRGAKAKLPLADLQRLAYAG